MQRLGLPSSFQKKNLRQSYLTRFPYKRSGVLPKELMKRIDIERSPCRLRQPMTSGEAVPYVSSLSRGPSQTAGHGRSHPNGTWFAHGSCRDGTDGRTAAPMPCHLRVPSRNVTAAINTGRNSGPARGVPHTYACQPKPSPAGQSLAGNVPGRRPAAQPRAFRSMRVVGPWHARGLRTPAGYCPVRAADHGGTREHRTRMP
jgi:hypothetical protein